MLTPRLFNKYNALVLECSYSYKHYTVIIKDRFLRHESFPFYVEFFVPLSPTNLYEEHDGCLSRTRKCLPFTGTLVHGHPGSLTATLVHAQSFVWSLLLILSFFFCLFSVFCAECSTCISGFSIVDVIV